MKPGPESDIPVACELTDLELRERKATLLAQFKSAVVATEELANGYAFHLAADGESILGAAKLIATERECCRFLEFALTIAPNMGAVTLRVTGPAGSKDFLQTTFL